MKKALLPILVIIIAVLVMIPMFNASAENQKLRGDADGDGVISITDVSTIQLLIAEMGEIEQENLAAAYRNRRRQRHSDLSCRIRGSLLYRLSYRFSGYYQSDRHDKKL